jgi:glutamine amidotransferase-like uncharacterized protein
MKILIVSFLLSISASCYGASVATIKIKQSGVEQVFQIKQDKTKSIISLKMGKEKAKIKKVHPNFASELISEANQITWQSAYRKPANQKKCSEYMQISFDRGKPETICQENRRATARAYGFVNKLNQSVR